MEEVWKDIQGYEDTYKISSFGNVLSVKKNTLLKQGITSHGYKLVSLWINGIGKTKIVHRLVATHFIKNPLYKLEVNHIDGNKLNNTIGNLEWCTRSENLEHAFSTGLSQSGERKSNSKLKDSDVHDIKSMYLNGWSKMALARHFSVSDVLIHYVIAGKRWRFSKVIE